MEMETNSMVLFVNLVDKIISEKNYVIQEEDKKILKEGLDNMFETFNEYNNHCSELYEGHNNALDDNVSIGSNVCECTLYDRFGDCSEEEDEYECLGCQSGVDTIYGHSRSCNERNGFYNYKF